MEDDLPFSSEQIAYGSLSTSAPLALTPPAAIAALLGHLRLSPADTFVDLGSGSGSLLIAAAQTGARAIGYESDAQLVAESRATLAAAIVSAEVLQKDLTDADLGDATVVYCYLVPRQQAALIPALERFLASGPGKRIATYEFPLPKEVPVFSSPTKDDKYPIFIYESDTGVE